VSKIVSLGKETGRDDLLTPSEWLRKLADDIETDKLDIRSVIIGLTTVCDDGADEVHYGSHRAKFHDLIVMGAMLSHDGLHLCAEEAGMSG